jgi:hypothetical protein
MTNHKHNLVYSLCRRWAGLQWIWRQATKAERVLSLLRVTNGILICSVVRGRPQSTMEFREGQFICEGPPMDPKANTGGPQEAQEGSRGAGGLRIAKG